MRDLGDLKKSIGPGLLFAGASIGASHLVQSTRAGANFGLAMLAVVIAANVIKYPAFSFAPRYAAGSGFSLLEGYRRIGTWALVLYGLVSLPTVVTVQAAVAFVTAGLAIALLQVDVDPLWLTAGIMASCLALVRMGSYRWLDRTVKLAVALLTLGTVAGTIAVLPRVPWGQAMWPPDDVWSHAPSFFFMAALVGWMPTAIDASVWHSLWTLAKVRDTGHRPTVRDAVLDFNIGYIGTAILGVCFVLLGAGVLHGRGVALPAGAAAFAAEVINLYTETLGEWARPVFGMAAFLVMYSTTLTVVDALPRTLSALMARLARPEVRGEAVGGNEGPGYWLFAAALFVLALVILSLFLTSLKDLVDLATTVSLLMAPPLAWLNHKVVFRKEMAAHRPSASMAVFSAVAIVIQTSFASYYIYLRFWAASM